MKRATTILLGLGLLATWLVPMPIKRKPMTEDDTTPPPENDFRSRIVQIAENEIGQPEDMKYAAAAIGVTEQQAAQQHMERLSWCGLFATWVLQKAGANVKWTLGKGICYKLPLAQEPKPGDIAYIDQPYQHHAIVEKVTDDGVWTIDGNSAGGKVARNFRPQREFTSFYDVSSLNPEGIT